MLFAELFGGIIERILVMIGYVGGSSAFPMPLSIDEEREYLEKYRNGDMSARNILIEHNLRLVAHIAKKYSNERDNEDLISIGTIGLIKGINTFDPVKNTRLAAYVARCVENEILMVLRSNKKLSGEVSIDECIGTDKDGNAMTFADILPAEDADAVDIVSDKIEAQKLYEAMKAVLKPSEIEILCYRYGLNNCRKKTQKEIAEAMGISRSYISRIEKKVIKKLSDVIKR